MITRGGLYNNKVYYLCTCEATITVILVDINSQTDFVMPGYGMQSNVSGR